MTRDGIIILISLYSACHGLHVRVLLLFIIPFFLRLIVAFRQLSHMPLRCMLHYANTSHMPLRVFYLDSNLVAESLDQVLAHTLFYIPFHILIIIVRVQPTVGYLLPWLGLCYSTLSCQSSYLSSLLYLNYL